MTAPRLLGFVAVALLAAAAHAVQPDEMLADAELEARARALGADLRCMVCPNQSIEDSDAPLARDLRILLRERLLAGDSDDMALAYLVERYGDYVLLRPPFGPATFLLWAAPVLGLAGAAAFFAMRIRRRAAAAPVGELDAAQRRRLRRLLDREAP